MHNHKISRSPENQLELDTGGYPTGQDGTVWATYDLRQAETIRNALVALHISLALKEKKQGQKILYVLHAGERKELEDAMDFIWREASGLRLHPDWHYPIGSQNESFTKWIDAS